MTYEATDKNSNQYTIDMNTYTTPLSAGHEQFVLSTT